MDHATAVIGLPGAGKSHTASYLANRWDAPVASLGDAVRTDAHASLGNEAAGKEIGDWLYDRFQRRGPGEFRAWVAGEVDDCLPTSRIIVDGVRTPESLAHLRDRTDALTVILLVAGFDIRFNRIRRRNRAGEQGYDPDYLRRRDTRDLEYGLERILAYEHVTHRFVNENDLSQLETQLDSVAPSLTA